MTDRLTGLESVGVTVKISSNAQQNSFVLNLLSNEPGFRGPFPPNESSLGAPGTKVIFCRKDGLQ